jgi:hypothetical protein
VSETPGTAALEQTLRTRVLQNVECCCVLGAPGYFYVLRVFLVLALAFVRLGGSRGPCDPVWVLCLFGSWACCLLLLLAEPWYAFSTGWPRLGHSGLGVGSGVLALGCLSLLVVVLNTRGPMCPVSDELNICRMSGTAPSPPGKFQQSHTCLVTPVLASPGTLDLLRISGRGSRAPAGAVPE